jgi:hypothetical protein
LLDGLIQTLSIAICFHLISKMIVMETNDENNSEELINDDTQFENADVDPGFSSHEEDNNQLEGREDKRENNIDVNLSISEMREGKTEGQRIEDSDALNSNNEREQSSDESKNN